MTSVAFIGLGHMGLPMVNNLLRKGFDVTAYDLSAEAMKGAVAEGAKAASGLAEAVGATDIVITMLPDGAAAKAVYFSEMGIVTKARRDALLIDCSTIDVTTAREVHAAAAEAGLACLDAPVSGGVGGAVAGTLTFMVGGSVADFERARPVLSAMGKAMVHAGEAGLGQAAKTCNNMVLGITMIGVAEAFALGRKLGLDDQTFFDIASVSSAACWSLNQYCPVPGPVPTSPANRDYEGGFAATLMLKDLRLAQQASIEAGASTPMGTKAAALYALMTEAGMGGLDFSAIIKMSPA